MLADGHCDICPYRDRHCLTKDELECAAGLLEWLKQEVEDGEINY